MFVLLMFCILMGRIYLYCVENLKDYLNMRGFRIFAAFVCISWLFSYFFALAAVAATEDLVIVQNDDPILIEDLNSRADPDNQDLPEYRFTVQLVNQKAFDEVDAPRVAVEDFRSFGDRGEIEILTEDGVEEYEFGASAWITGSQSLTNLANDAVNELDFSVDLPDNQEAGSYTAALVFKNKTDGELGNYPIIINVGVPDERQLELELVSKSTSINLADKSIEVGLRSLDYWHIDATVQVAFTGVDESGTEQSSLIILAQDKFLGILPNTQQIFSSDDELLETILALSDLEAQVIVEEKGTDNELLEFDISNFIVLEAAEDEDDSQSDGAVADTSSVVADTDSKGNQVAGDDNETQVSGGFLQGNLVLLIIVTVVLIPLLIIIFIIKRKKNMFGKVMPSQIKPPSPPSQAPAITPTAPVSPQLRGIPDLPQVESLSNNSTPALGQAPFNRDPQAFNHPSPAAPVNRPPDGQGQVGN